MVQLSTELLMPEPFGESGDGLDVSDVGNEVSCLREEPDEVTQGLLGRTDKASLGHTWCQDART